jgi:hypothetical protein
LDWSIGGTFDLLSIVPGVETSGSLAGINVQYFPGKGVGIYAVGPGTTPAAGGIMPGLSASVNIAYGSGPWEGNTGNVALFAPGGLSGAMSVSQKFGGGRGWVSLSFSRSRKRKKDYRVRMGMGFYETHLRCMYFMSDKPIRDALEYVSTKASEARDYVGDVLTDFGEGVGNFAENVYHDVTGP